jgi:hypothetical protein
LAGSFNYISSVQDGGAFKLLNCGMNLILE